MISSDGFRILNKMYEGHGFILYRALKEKDGTPVILKQLKYETPHGSPVNGHMEGTKSLEHESILRIVDTARFDCGPVPIMEDFGGEVLENILKDDGISMGSFFKITIKLADILAFIHGTHATHDHINPENIFVHGEIVKLTAPGYHDSIPSGDQILHSRMGDLYAAAYISPEQTGRVTQRVDYRTDFYSLGILFYRMLTGVLPFASTDYTEIIYSHLAREAVPVYRVNEKVPRVLSDIVGKLMEKNAESRYQTAAGLKYDLEECLKGLKFNDGRYEAASFPLGQYDVPEELHLPQGVFGREKELQKLVDAFHRVKEGIPKVLFISGYSGVGKTTLVNELYTPVKKSGGLFIQGKSDQYKKTTPYDSLRQAFDLLFTEILSQDKASIFAWKSKITAALGSNTGIITAIFPKLEKIIGPQEPVESLPIHEAHNRFNRVMINFLQAVASVEKPLVIFLDDLHWADHNSIQLLQLMLSVSERIHVLFIGAYRDNEAANSPSLQSLLDNMAAGLGASEIICLDPLNLSDVRRMLSEILHYTSRQTEILARLCHKKTGGNPFFLWHFIMSLKDDGQLYFDPEKRTWEMKLEHIVSRSATDNVVDLMVGKIEKLPQGTIEILKLAACINNTFDVETLSVILGVSRDSTAEALMQAIREGLVVSPEQDLYYREEKNNEPVKYRFLHDRVQQAAYLLIDERQKIDFHYRIGSLLLEKSPEFEKSENLLEITDHLNLAENIVQVRKEGMMLVVLNLEAGKKAREYSAYEMALDYFSRGICLLGNTDWNSHHEMVLELYTEAAEMAYICAKYRLVDKFISSVLDREKNLLPMARVYRIKIEALTAQNRLEKAIDTARDVLKLFGIKIPRRPSFLNIMVMYYKIRWTLRGRSFNDLKNMPKMEDEQILTIMEIINSAGIAAYSYSSSMMMILTLHMVYLSLRHGIAPQTPVSYSAYGHFLCAHMKKRELGYQFGKLAVEIQGGLKSKAFECKTLMAFEIVIRHHKEHVRNTLKSFPYSHQTGLNTGDLISAGHSIMQYFVYLYLSGKELSPIQKEMEQYRDTLEKTDNRTAITVCMMYLQGIVNLLETSEKPWILAGPFFDEENTLPHYKAVNDRTIIFNSYFNKMIISYLLGQYDEAYENLNVVEEYMDGAIGTYCMPVYYFYGALIHMELLESHKGMDKILHKKKLRACIHEVKSFYKDCLENNENKYTLILAEEARIIGNHRRAMEYYDQSIKAAGENGFLQEEALANELAARYYHSMGGIRIFGNYERNALYCYGKWGSPLKVRQLQEQYSDLIQEAAASDDMAGCLLGKEFFSPFLLDVNTIVKASQAISEEIVLEELLKKMIRIVIKNAGARKALFIVERDGRLYIEAEGSTEDRTVKVMEGTAVEGITKISLKLLNYVANTRESLALNSRDEIDRFTHEPAVHDIGPKSLLCIPVESKRSLVGLLYLENDLIEGAFTDQHLLVLKVLASQLAISMENARLYQDLEKIVGERTEQLRSKNYELECTNIQLENVSRAKTEFIANVSHEMRTPLHGVMGIAGLLQKTDLSPKQKEHVDSIIISADSLLEIINDILDLSKIEANMVELQERDFDLNQLVKDILPVFMVKAEEKGLKLYSTIRQEAVQCFRGDPLKINRVISNLLSNAVKFTEKGEVELMVSAAKRGHDKAVVEITVKDSGIGIPPDKLDFIFENFTQVDRSTTRKYGGTGLGLSITKKLVELMQGTITVDSTPGMGSTFKCILSLGLAEADNESSASGTGESPQSYKEELASLRVLAAEDNIIGRKYVKALLKYLKCDVTLASNGLEVLEMLKTGTYDCILMDKNMPELDGIETTRIIRKNEEGTGKHIPIIALTASAIFGDKEKLLSEGMDYYLSKPIMEMELVNMLKSVKNGIENKKPLESGNQAEEGQFINRKVFLEEAALYGEDIYLEIISDFTEEYPRVLQRIKEHLDRADFKKAGREIHKFAGTLSTFHCPGLVKTVRDMEQKAAQKDMEALKTAHGALIDSIQFFMEELDDIRKVIECGY